MRFSQLFIQTHRDPSGDLSSPGMQFLHRAGYIRQVDSGVYGFYPLAKRSMQKMENSIRQELAYISGQEIDLPMISSEDQKQHFALVPPFEFPSLKTTGCQNRQWNLTKIPTKHLLDLVSHNIRSHRQLPRLLYQFQPKINLHNPTPASFLGQRTSHHLECFLLEKDPLFDNPNHQKIAQSFQRIFTTWNLPFELIKYDDQTTRNSLTHEFYFNHPSGDRTIIYCPACGYKSTQSYSHSYKLNTNEKDLLPLDEVYTPDTKTIDDLSNFLHIDPSQTAKAVFLMATIPNGGGLREEVILAIVRGDMELDEQKLARVIQAYQLRPANEEEIFSIGAVPGFASPVGLKNGFIVIDDLILHSKNLVAGANKKNFHFKNVNFKRDYQADLIADISVVNPGDHCPQCHQSLQAKQAFLFAQIYASPDPDAQNGCTYQDESGKQKTVQIGYAWMDYEKVLAAIAETYHDTFGLIMPYYIAPFQVHLVVLPSKNSTQPVEIAEKLYQDLRQARMEVLFDDRQESPGVKFNDADLIGIPIRITIAEKSLNEGMLELKLRCENEKKLVKLEDIVLTTMHTLLQMEREVAQKVANLV